MPMSSTFMTAVHAKEELVEKANQSAAPEKPKPIIKTIYAPAEVKTVYVYKQQTQEPEAKPDPNAPPPCKD